MQDIKSTHRNQKSLAFLYTNNQRIEIEIKETSPFTIAMKKIKYLGIYLPKETKDIYIENYETQVKEIKRTLLDEKIYCVHGKKVGLSFSNPAKIKRNSKKC